MQSCAKCICICTFLLGFLSLTWQMDETIEFADGETFKEAVFLCMDLKLSWIKTSDVAFIDEAMKLWNSIFSRSKLWRLTFASFPNVR